MLTLAQADTIIDAAIAKRREMDFAPLTLVVLDAGGNMIAMKREDKSGIMRADIAYAKAWGALGMGMNSREIAERANQAPTFYGSLYPLSQGRLAPAPGGNLVHDGNGELLGSVGASGDMGGNDETCVLAGIAAAGLTAA